MYSICCSRCCENSSRHISCCGSGEKGLGIAVVGFIDAW